jgi:hypothetical protein
MRQEGEKEGEEKGCGALKFNHSVQDQSTLVSRKGKMGEMPRYRPEDVLERERLTVAIGSRVPPCPTLTLRSRAVTANIVELSVREYKYFCRNGFESRAWESGLRRQKEGGVNGRMD